ncbi:MAG: acyl carrier protein [Acidobacteriota bacterium]|nr:acyl carrier protein [Acidobacteriota bacterium]
MDHDAILAKAQTIISETLDVDEDDITEETEFRALEADSFDMLELISAFEDEFDMEMPDDGLDEIVTVGDLIAGIEAAQQ